MQIGSIFVLHISSQQSLHYVGSFTKGFWICRTKIDPICIFHPYPCFLNFSSNGHPYIFFHFTEMFFLLLVHGIIFFCLYGFMYVVCMHNARVHSSMCMQGQKFLKIYSSPIAQHPNDSY